MDAQLDTLTQVKRTLLDIAIRFGPKVLVALLILCVGVMVSRGARRTTASMAARPS